MYQTASVTDDSLNFQTTTLDRSIEHHGIKLKNNFLTEGHTMRQMNNQSQDIQPSPFLNQSNSIDGSSAGGTIQMKPYIQATMATTTNTRTAKALPSLNDDLPQLKQNLLLGDQQNSPDYYNLLRATANQNSRAANMNEMTGGLTHTTMNTSMPSIAINRVHADSNDIRNTSTPILDRDNQLRRSHELKQATEAYTNVRLNSRSNMNIYDSNMQSATTPHDIYFDQSIQASQNRQVPLKNMGSEMNKNSPHINLSNNNTYTIEANMSVNNLFSSPEAGRNHRLQAQPS